VPAQEKLTPTEQYLAYLTGLGIAVAVAALLLTALGTIENDNITVSLLLVGLALVILGVGGWLILLRPWEKFDDLKTPYYVGHEERAHAAEGVTAFTGPGRPAGPDDLTLIEGIGPKSAAALAAAGITRFEQVAALSAEELEKTIKERKVRLVGSTATWPIQAHFAASGDLTALHDFQARIKGGILHDDLTRIEGIGPKVQAALYLAGIRTFQDVAHSAPDALRKVLVDAGLKTVSPERWPEQASLVVSDDLTGLKKLQDEM